MGSRIIESAAYCYQILLAHLYTHSAQNTSVNWIIRLSLSLWCRPKVILLSGGHCICDPNSPIYYCIRGFDDPKLIANDPLAEKHRYKVMDMKTNHIVSHLQWNLAGLFFITSSMVMRNETTYSSLDWKKSMEKTPPSFPSVGKPMYERFPTFIYSLSLSLKKGEEPLL